VPDGLAWGLVPLFLAAHGARAAAIGLVAAVYPGRPSRADDPSAPLALMVRKVNDGWPADEGTVMDEDAFNMSVRRFLKKLGVTAQREIELAVRERLEAGELRGDERLEATATITVGDLSRDVIVTGTIALS
jgi:hypothetical protein